jgi:3-oxoadipate enol-lactonase
LHAACATPSRSELTTARLNGTEIAYETAGEGPPVVLLHAAVGDRRLWDGQVPALAERHLVVRYDLRGFGDSPLPGGPFSNVDDLAALLDHLGIERAALVGNSFGGKVALEFALERPERTPALVLISPALEGHERSAELEAFDEAEESLLEAGEVDEAVELNLRTWLDGPGRDAAPVSPEARELVASGQRRAFETMLAAYERTPPPGPVRWADPPAATRLAEIAAPTLVVACAHDVADFRAIAERLGREIPGARTVVFDTAHLPGLERPEELNRLLLDFLSTGGN